MINLSDTNSEKKLSGWPWTEETNPSVYSKHAVWPKISIITPSFNQGNFIEETIRSILLQNYPNLEYIIIDGGSTDNTVEIIKKYAPWITYWVSEKDKGQSDAINKGIKLCTGDIFNWINSDDFLEPNALKAIGEAFITNNCEIVCGYIDVFDDLPEGYKTNFTHRMVQIKNLEEKVFDADMNQPGTFWKLSIIKELNGIVQNLHYCMDLELFHRYIAKKGTKNIVYIEDKLVKFRLHGQSKTVSLLDKFRQECELINISIIQSSGIPAEIMDKIKRSIPNYYYDSIWNLAALNQSKIIVTGIQKIIFNYIELLSYADKIRLFIFYLTKVSSKKINEIFYFGRVLLLPLFIKKLVKR
jgi:glycosyltransferase involved in cell wall biosynthesis